MQLFNIFGTRSDRNPWRSYYVYRKQMNAVCLKNLSGACYGSVKLHDAGELICDDNASIVWSTVKKNTSYSRQAIIPQFSSVLGPQMDLMVAKVNYMTSLGLIWVLTSCCNGLQNIITLLSVKDRQGLNEFGIQLYIYGLSENNWIERKKNAGHLVVINLPLYV